MPEIFGVKTLYFKHFLDGTEGYSDFDIIVNFTTVTAFRNK